MLFICRHNLKPRLSHRLLLFSHFKVKLSEIKPQVQIEL